MKSIAGRSAVLVFALLFSTGALTMAQQSQTTIKKTPIAASSQELFNSYCAVCHGNNAKGKWPSFSRTQSSPTGPNRLSQRHGGTYPTMYVERVLGSERQTSQRTEPKAAPIRKSLGFTTGGANAPQTAQRIYDLNQYIESLQAK